MTALSPGARRSVDERVLDGDSGGLRTICCTQLAEQVGDMGGHGAVPDEQPLGDFGIGQALTELFENVLLAVGKHKGGGPCVVNPCRRESRYAPA